VDPPEKKHEGASQHLEMAETRRQARSFKREHGFTLASPGGQMKDMGWLEFAPREFRPDVHVVASSHVLSPFLWKEYYPQDWLSKVRKEHCRYSLEVFDEGNSVAEFALEGEPMHHPEGRDVALAHFKDEDVILPKLKDLGIDILHLRGAKALYEKDENILFDGYAVVGGETDENNNANINNNAEEKEEQDGRVFHPLRQPGNLSFRLNDRFFATTDIPLPEGMCGAPALDEKGFCCGVVEGIVPTDHENKSLAGSAAFMPSYVMQEFVEYAERKMLRALMPDDLFQSCVAAKKTNTIGGGVFKLEGDGNYTTNTNWEEAYDGITKELKSRYSKEEYEAYMSVVEDEKEQIKEILNKEGGDMQEIMHRVRERTLELREKVHEEYRKQQSKDT